MPWLVVKFDPEDTVEAVPNTWYVKDKSQCYWPPEDTAKNVIKDLIKKKRSPEANWILYGAIILGCYDDYKEAQRKATKAIKKNTDNLSSNNENLKRKRSISKKNKKKGRKRVEHESEYESSSEAEISSSDDSMYPQLKNKEADMVENFEFTNQGNVYNKERGVENQSNNNNNDNSTIASTISCATSTVKATLQHKSPLALGHGTDFEKRVFRELHILSLKIDDISESVNVLIKNKADESQNLHTHNKVPDIVELFPVNDESLAQLENWLTSSEQNRTDLSQNLSRIGGSNVKDIVRRIMYRVFTNEVGMCYSWEGAKKKKAFKNLIIATTIFSAVRHNKNTQNCTDLEIIDVIKAWLVRSKDRFNNNNNKNKDTADKGIESFNNVENPDTQSSQRKD